MESNKYWKEIQKKWANEPINNFAKRLVKEIKGKKFKNILDLGCGTGKDALYFAERGYKVTAVDFSKAGIEMLKAEDNQNVNYVLQDLQKLRFKNDSFDVVYAHLSLHYFDDTETDKIFKKLYKILKPGGYIFVKCKSVDDSLYGVGKKIGDNMYQKGHVRHFFSKEYMVEKLKDFDILKIRRSSSRYHTYKCAFIEAVAKKPRKRGK